MGQSLEGGWEIVEMITKPPTGTGGHFSVCYRVRNSNSGKEAFLKALDFSEAMKSADRLKKLQEMLDAYIFERDLLEKCKDRRMSRISTPITSGSVNVGGFGDYSTVYYLIFELADGGDIRRYRSSLAEFDLKWCLGSLHHVAVGIKQLHGNGIAHQDLKPSNVLVMSTADTRIADLGRASDSEVPSPNDGIYSGDRNYAPVDLYFSDISINGIERKFLTDIYLFGGLIFFYFTGVNASQALWAQLTKDQRALIGQTSFKQVLPYLQFAFKGALDKLKEEVIRIAPDYADDLMELARQMCEPDPEVRGDPKWRATVVPNYDLQRVISKLNVLASSVRKTT